MPRLVPASSRPAAAPTGARRLRSGLLAGGTVVALAVAGIALTPVAASAATTVAVTTTADVDPSTIQACTTPSVTDPATAAVSLREAICVANNRGDVVTVTVPAGTYAMSYGEFQVGTAAGSDITLSGSGAGATVLDAGRASRVLELDPDLVGGVSVGVTGMTLQNGLPADGPSGTLGGGAILAGTGGTGAPSDSLRVTSARFVGNTASSGGATNAPGGAVQMAGGVLSVADTTFSQNTAGQSPGGAIAYLGTSAADDVMTVTTSTFTSNTVSSDGTSSPTGNAGGAVYVDAAVAGSGIDRSAFSQNSASGAGSTTGGAIALDDGTLAVTRTSFDTNSATTTRAGGTTGTGGAIASAGTLTATYDRFTGNAATTAGPGIARTAGTVTADDDWWGCNAGPVGGCQTNAGTVAVSRWLRLGASAAPATVRGPDARSTITASFATDSAGATVAAADLAAFTGLSAQFAVDAGGDSFVGGSTSATTRTDAGVATAAYDSGTATGARTIRATALGVTVPTTVTVQAAPTITSADSAGFTLGAAGSSTITTSGFPTPTITEAGTLPAGLTFTDAGDGTATIAGTPTRGGSFPVTITADNGSAPAATQTLRIDVTAAPAITSAPTATFRAGTAGSFTVTTTGVPTPAVTVTGTLPDGVRFVDGGDGTATISGTASAAQAGSYRLDLAADNGVDPVAVQAFTLQVTTPPAVTTEPASQTVQPGTAVTVTAAASGFPTPTVQWQRSTDGGTTFTDVAGATSTDLTFTATRADDGDRYRAVFTNSTGTATSTAAEVRVGTAPRFTSADATRVVVGTAFAYPVTTTGTPTATLSAAGLPDWATLTDHGDGTGTLSGTAPAGAGGVTTSTLRAENGFAPDAAQTFTLTVDEVPTITSADHATFAVGDAGTFTITTTPGYPATTTIGTTTVLPAWLTLTDRGDGTATLRGTPTGPDAGTVELDVTASNATGSSPVQRLTLTVTDPPVITTTGPTIVAPGAPVSLTIGTGDAFPVPTVALDTVGGPFLPAGLTFTDDGDGTATISGTPTGPSVTDLVVVADNGVGGPVRATVTLTIEGGPTITSAPTATFRVGVDGSAAVTATNGVPSTTSLRIVGTLPDGLRFTQTPPMVRAGLSPAASVPGATSGTISGTPTTAGTYRFTVIADNGVGDPSVQAFVLTVDPAAASPTGTGGAGSAGGSGVGGSGGGTGAGPAGVGPGGAPSVTGGAAGRLASTGGTLSWDLVAGAFALVLAGLVLTLRRRRDRA